MGRYALACWIAILMGLQLSSRAVAEVITLNSVADAHVDSLAPDTNFGASNELYIASAGQHGGSGSLAFLKFQNNLASSTIVNSASFRVYFSDDYFPAPPTVTANVVIDDSWTENGITWNNRPTQGAAIGTQSPALNTYALFDVTAFVQSEISSASPFISFGLSPGSLDSWADYSSREGTFAPILEINTVAVPEPSSFVTILVAGVLGMLGYRRLRSRRMRIVTN